MYNAFQRIHALCILLTLYNAICKTSEPTLHWLKIHACELCVVIKLCTAIWNSFSNWKCSTHCIDWNYTLESVPSINSIILFMNFTVIHLTNLVNKSFSQYIVLYIYIVSITSIALCTNILYNVHILQVFYFILQKIIFSWIVILKI